VKEMFRDLFKKNQNVTGEEFAAPTYTQAGFKYQWTDNKKKD